MHYRSSGEHKIAVEAVDALNLSKTSMEIPVTVTVIQAPHGVAAIFGRYRQYITWGAVGLAGLVLLLILFVGRLPGHLFQEAHVPPGSGRPRDAVSGG